MCVRACVCVCECVREFMCVYMCAGARVCVCVCLTVCQPVFVVYRMRDASEGGCASWCGRDVDVMMCACCGDGVGVMVIYMVTV